MGEVDTQVGCAPASCSCRLPSMLKKTLTAACLLAAFATSGGTAAAADVVAPDPGAHQVTALDGRVVWVTGEFGAQRLVQRTADGTVGPVPGAPQAQSYQGLDLGRDAQNRPVLTYSRCTTPSSCKVLQDDLAGTRRSFRGLAPQRCALSTAPALWRGTTAFGLLCRTGSGAFDARRSGLHVRTPGGAVRRIAAPPEAQRAGSGTITHVDLRGTRVAAAAVDIASWAFTSDTRGRGTRGFLAGSSEGETDQRVAGLELGAGGVLWTLTQSTTSEEPYASIIGRLGSGDCLERQTLRDAGGPGEAAFPLAGLAVDGRDLLVAQTGTGVVRHAFAADHAC